MVDQTWEKDLSALGTPTLFVRELLCCADDPPSGPAEELQAVSLPGDPSVTGDGTLPELVALQFRLQRVPQPQLHLDGVAGNAGAGKSFEGQVGQPGSPVGNRIGLV